MCSSDLGTGHYSGFLDRVDAGHAERDPFGDHRALGTRAQPDRVRPDGAAARGTERTAGRRRRAATGLASPA